MLQDVFESVGHVEGCVTGDNTAVQFVRAAGDHRNATSAENGHVARRQLLVAPSTIIPTRFDPEGALCLESLDITPDPTAGQAHHQLGDVERAVQSLKRREDHVSSDERPQQTWQDDRIQSVLVEICVQPKSVECGLQSPH